MSFLSIGASLLGGLLGSKNKAASTTEKKEPWAPAQPYLTENLARNKQLQDYYSQNPFNGLQQQGYENLFGDQNNFRQNIAPGLMQFANNGMNSNYQRQQHAQPGQAGYGLLSSPQQQGQQTGLLAPFSVAQSKPYTVGNLNAQSPFYQSPETVAAAAAKLAEEERLKKLQQSQQTTYDRSNSNTGYGWDTGYGA